MTPKQKQYTSPFIKPKGSLTASGFFAASILQEAISLHKQGKLDQAELIYIQLLEVQPKNADVIHLLGVIAHQTARYQRAVDIIGEAIEINPNVASYYSNQGNALKVLKQFDLAVACYEKAINLKPDYAEAYSNRGNALKELKQFDLALESYKKAIDLKPDLAEAHSNCGIALKELKQFGAAVTSYEKAIELKPNYAEAYFNRGIALNELKQFEAAIDSYEKAIELKPEWAEALSNLGDTQKELRKFDAAIVSYEKAIKLKPDYEYLFGVLQHTKMLICEWQGFEQHVLELGQRIALKLKASPCFHTLAVPISMANQRIAAEIWCLDKYPYNPSLGPLPKSERKLKIRLGYFSADFHNHATTYLMAELFERHERSEFEVIAFSFGKYKNDEMRNRVTSAFDHFIDVSSMDDKAVAIKSRELGIDIAIDLKGHTKDERLGIFTYRAAPIQVSYLGYPGTLGADFIDYLIADKTVIPQESQNNYSEKIVYLPHSYQVNDRQRIISQRQFTKLEVGLPEEGFVFCSFNNNYKITPDVFDLWVRILKAVDKSVLWLLEDNQTAVNNLQRQAAARGIDPARLVFAKRLDLPDHLARHKMADLFLDTMPCNAHTTASDALWAGLPVITCLGESFAGRVAASLLNAIGLSDLVTSTQSAYEALAIELSTNSMKLKSFKHKLDCNRLAMPLFDTPQYTNHLEAAYKIMYQRYQDGIAPDNIYITDLSL